LVNRADQVLSNRIFAYQGGIFYGQRSAQDQLCHVCVQISEKKIG